MLIFILPGFSGLHSQTPSIRRYGTQEYQKKLIESNLYLKDSIQIQESFITDFIKVGSPTQLTIPVVFHIISNSDMPTITINMISQQLDAINRDFDDLDTKVYGMSEYTEPFIDRASIPLKRFCLPSLQNAPTGLTPINYVSSKQNKWQVGNQMKSSQNGGSDPYNPEKYLNIWVCDLVDSISGFSQMPCGPLETDGIVIDYSYFLGISPNDSTYNQGKTLTHLVGSYLGLNELWNEYYPCFDDGVFDTPVHNEPNRGIQLANRHVSTCFGNEVEMTMNFMDNTDDELLYMFTKGQILRMQAFLSPGGSRNGLVKNSFHCNDTLLVDGRSEKSDFKNLIIQNDNRLSLSVKPNPTSSSFGLWVSTTNSQDLIKLQIVDILGQVIWNDNSPVSKEDFFREVNCSNWNEGVYLIILKSTDCFLFRKIIVSH